MVLLFWISLAVLFYAYLGYGLLLSLYRFLCKRKEALTNDFQPPLTVIVPAYNEEECIEQKIQNCFSLNYPSHLLTVLVITDGSTDNTAFLAGKYSGIQHLHQPERRGKTAAINRAMLSVETPFVVFTDANTILHPDSLQRLVRHYTNKKTGGVAGEKQIVSADGTTVGTGEQMYWRYESMIKKANASFYTVVGAAGELFSIRTALFSPLNENIILDDFVQSAKICLKGYRLAYEEKARALEPPSENIREERKRKTRISAGCFQALVLLPDLLNPFRNPRLAFQYISHRVLRWTLCPLLVPLVFLLNGLIVYRLPTTLYSGLLLIQFLFYTVAFLGWITSRKKWLPGFLYIPYYFVFMNMSLYIGFYRFFTGQQSVFWPKARRKLFVPKNYQS